MRDCNFRFWHSYIASSSYIDCGSAQRTEHGQRQVLINLHTVFPTDQAHISYLGYVWQPNAGGAGLTPPDHPAVGANRLAGRCNWYGLERRQRLWDGLGKLQEEIKFI